MYKYILLTFWLIEVVKRLLQFLKAYPNVAPFFLLWGWSPPNAGRRMWWLWWVTPGLLWQDSVPRLGIFPIILSRQHYKENGRASAGSAARISIKRTVSFGTLLEGSQLPDVNALLRSQFTQEVRDDKLFDQRLWPMSSPGPWIGNGAHFGPFLLTPVAGLVKKDASISLDEARSSYTYLATALHNVAFHLHLGRMKSSFSIIAPFTLSSGPDIPFTQKGPWLGLLIILYSGFLFGPTSCAGGCNFRSFGKTRVIFNTLFERCSLLGWAGHGPATNQPPKQISEHQNARVLGPQVLSWPFDSTWSVETGNDSGTSYLFWEISCHSYRAATSPRAPPPLCRHVTYWYVTQFS